MTDEIEKKDEASQVNDVKEQIDGDKFLDKVRVAISELEKIVETTEAEDGDLPKAIDRFSEDNLNHLSDLLAAGDILEAIAVKTIDDIEKSAEVLEAVAIRNADDDY